MYGLEILCHKTDSKPSTEGKLYWVEVQNIVLGIGPQFFEPIKDDVPTDLKNAWETFDIENNDAEMDEPPLNVHGASALPPIDMAD